MDARQKIEAVKPRSWPSNDALRHHLHGTSEPADNAASLESLLQTLASKEAELSEAALKHIALFGELQNAMGEIAGLREAMKAWKTEAEYQYGQLRLQRNPSETDYPVDGALDAYARGKHPAIAALTQPTKD